MVYYWNFIMIHEGTLSQRVRYNILDILEEVGGIYSAISSLVFILFSAYNYKLHESIVYQEFLKTKGLKQDNMKLKQIVDGNTKCLSIQYFLYDHLKSLC